MPFSWTIFRAFPFLTGSEKESFKDNLIVHLKEDLYLVLLLFIHKNFEGEYLEVSCIFDTKLRGEEIDLVFSECLD